MSIVSSAITKDRLSGGLRFVEETHVDSGGIQYTLKRFAPVGYDVAADLAVHAAQIAEQLANDEALALLGDE
jgi:hypothetical protein